MTSWEFAASDPIDLRVRIPAGRITVTAARAQAATVTLSPEHPGGRGEKLVAATRVEFDQGTLSVIAPERRLLNPGAWIEAAVELPEGSSCLVDTASADVSCTGELSALDVRSASGDVSAERVTGLARIGTASGDVEVGEAAELTVHTASGDVSAARVDGEISVRTASGDVQIGEASGRRTDIKATSGDISVAVTPGIRIYLDISTLSGTASSELEPSGESGSTDMTLVCRTISGDVQISRAAQPAAR
jgi:hypothetical protein